MATRSVHLEQITSVLNLGRAGVFLGHSVSLLAVFALALLSARLFWVAVGEGGGPLTMLSSAPTSAQIGRAHNLAILQRSTPFQTIVAERASDVRPDAVVGAPETELKLTLHGVRSDLNGEGVAVISEENEAQELYRVGDELNNSGVTIDRIYADGVLLSRQGRVERLPIQPDDRVSTITTLGEGDVPDDVDELNVSSGNVETTRPPPDEGRGSASRIRNASASVNRSELMQLFQTLRFEAAPDTVEGGVMVFPTSSAGPFAKSGLRARDIIRSINGVELSRDTDYSSLLDDLERGDRAVVSLLRAGERWRLTIEINS